MTTKNKNINKHLFYLDELSDYKVADNDPDVRGWQVKDKDNRVIGKVDNLLVNKEAERVVYLDVEVDNNIVEANHDPYGQPANNDIREFINKEGENHIIIPVGLVDLNKDQKFVYTDQIDHRTFAETKRYEKGTNINREYEVVVLESYDRRNSTNDDLNRRDSSFDNSEKKTSGGRTSYDSIGNTGSERSDSRLTDDKLGNRNMSDERYDEDRKIIRPGSSSEERDTRETKILRADTTSERYDDDRDVSRTGSTYGHDRKDNDHGISDRDRNDDYRSDRDRRRSDDDFYERREFNGSHFRRNR